MLKVSPQQSYIQIKSIIGIFSHKCRHKKLSQIWSRFKSIWAENQNTITKPVSYLLSYLYNNDFTQKTLSKLTNQLKISKAAYGAEQCMKAINTVIIRDHTSIHSRKCLKTWWSETDLKDWSPSLWEGQGKSFRFCWSNMRIRAQCFWNHDYKQ